MAEERVTKEMNQFNAVNSEESTERSIYGASRISLQEARGKVKRVGQRLDLLIDTLSLAETDDYSWSAFYLVHNKKNAEKRRVFPDEDSDGVRGRMLTFIAEVIAQARWEAEECYAWVDPEEAVSKFPPGIIETIKLRPVCSWDGPDMIELCIAIDLIGAVYDGLVGEHNALLKISESAVYGFVVVLEDIRDRLEGLLTKMDSYIQKQAHSKEEEVA